MARCNCDSPAACGCAAEAGDLGDLTVTGIGSVGDPFVIDDPSFQRVATTAARDSIASPQEGWLAYVLATDLYYRYTGTAWTPLSGQVIASTELSVAAADMDFLSVNQEGTTLRFTGWMRSTVASVTAGLDLRFNGDAGNNYYRERCDFNDATVTASSAVAQSSLSQFLNIPGSTNSQVADATTFLVPDYRDAAHRKGVIGHSHTSGGTAAGNQLIRIGGGMWDNVAAINRVRVNPAAGNFDAGSRLDIELVVGKV